MLTSGLFRHYLCCAAGSQGWIIGPVIAHPSLLVVCSPSYSRSVAELRGEHRSTSLWQLIYDGLGVTSDQFTGAGESVCWWVQRWGEFLTDTWLDFHHFLLTNLWQSQAEALTSEKCSKLTPPTTSL